MAEPLVLTYLPDTLASESRPSMNFVKRPDIYLRGGAGQRVLGYIMGRGFPRGADVVIVSCVLRLFPIEDAASSTITARRILPKPSGDPGWTSGSLRFSNAPPVSSTAHTYTGTLTKDVPIEIDLTSVATAWADGSLPNYGVRLETNATTARVFHSANASGKNVAMRPQLVITYTTKPETPQGFVATGGGQVSVARPNIPWTYADDAGSPIVAYQFQANETDAWGGPQYDSGEVATDEPLHPWHEDLADGEMVWYRVRHKNADNRWSDWSDAHQFGRTVKPALTVPQPSGVVADYSPTAAWSFAGTQTQFRVQYSTEVGAPRISSWIAGDDSSFAFEAPLRVAQGVPITATVSVIDDVERVATPGDPVEITASGAPFTFGPVVAIDIPTNVVAGPEGEGPIVAVGWDADTSDGFIIERRIDGGEWETFPVEPGDVLNAGPTAYGVGVFGVGAYGVGGSGYAWRDTTAPAWHKLEYRVRSVVNGEMGVASYVVTTECEPSAIFLVDPDDADWVLPIWGDDEGEWSMAEDSSVHHVVGSDRAILVHEGLGGYEDQVTGYLLDQAARDMAWRLKRQPLKVWRLMLSDLNIPVVVRMVTIAPQAEPTPRYDIGFEFYQQGDLPWQDA